MDNTCAVKELAQKLNDAAERGRGLAAEFPPDQFPL
jgi:hypothetical protein